MIFKEANPWEVESSKISISKIICLTYLTSRRDLSHVVETLSNGTSPVIIHNEGNDAHYEVQCTLIYLEQALGHLKPAYAGMVVTVTRFFIWETRASKSRVPWRIDTTRHGSQEVASMIGLPSVLVLK